MVCKLCPRVNSCLRKLDGCQNCDLGVKFFKLKKSITNLKIKNSNLREELDEFKSEYELRLVLDTGILLQDFFERELDSDKNYSFDELLNLVRPFISDLLYHGAIRYLEGNDE